MPASSRPPAVREDAQSQRVGVRRAAVRGLAILGVLVIWLTVVSIGGPLIGRLSEVQDNDNANFLPAKAESNLVSKASQEFTGKQPLPYFLVFERDGGLTQADSAAIQGFIQKIPTLQVDVDTSAIVDESEVKGSYPLSDYLVDEAPAVIPSQDGEAAIVVVNLDADASSKTLPDGTTVVFGVAESLRRAIKTTIAPTGLHTYITGIGGILADFVVAFEGIDGTLLEVTLGVVFLILLLVYRSPVLPLAALTSAVFALGGAALVIYPLADAGTIKLNGQSQGILFILVVGAATDYALLLVSRYREALHDHRSKYAAMRHAWRLALPPIAASAATVVLGLLCLLLSDLGSTRGLGPIGAIGIAFALVAGLTLLPVLLLVPAILLALVALGVGAGAGGALAGTVGAAVGAVIAALVFAALAVGRWRVRRDLADGSTARLPLYARAEPGRWLFWPRVPRTDGVHAEDYVGQGGVWGRVASMVGHRPRTVAIVTFVGLLALAAFVPQFKAAGIKQTDIFLNKVESVTGQAVLEAHFPAGSGSPADILVAQQDAAAATEVAEGLEGVASVVPYTGVAVGPGSPPGDPVVVDGQVMLEATLEPAADSPEAEAVVKELRFALDAVSPDALVGGLTAGNLDVREASNRDLHVILPAILLVILVILMILLRAIVAPVLIILANVLSFAATIGTSALVFNYVFDLPGGDPAIPLYGFVFLVALGIDYSIFLMTRVREESAQRGTRPGILVGLAVTGGVITSAGVVLAATFSALATLPIIFLLQVAFLVAFGVLLDTLIVRSLLVPAVTYAIGPAIWWPGGLWRHGRVERGAAPGNQLVDGLRRDGGSHRA